MTHAFHSIVLLRYFLNYLHSVMHTEFAHLPTASVAPRFSVILTGDEGTTACQLREDSTIKVAPSLAHLHVRVIFFHTARNVTHFERVLKYPENGAPHTELYATMKCKPGKYVRAFEKD